MDGSADLWHFPDMGIGTGKIRTWQLYGEDTPFPDILHVERIADRAAGLDWRIDTHRHAGLHQFFLFLSSDVSVVIEGRDWAVAAPCLLNIPAGTTHAFRFGPGTEGYVLTLSAADFPELLAGDGPAARRLSQAFPANPDAGVERLFADALALHRGGDALRALGLRALALQLGLWVARAAGDAKGGETGGEARANRIAAFEAQVRAHPGSNRSIADHAAALGMSDRHLRRLCQEETGQSAHALIEDIRLREACRLLAFTRARVQEVGFATGFDDPAYFARAFRRRMGLSPSDYRARLAR